MRHRQVYRAWGAILQGRRPVIALEITNKCPLSCPGCYAYQPNHVSGIPLESVADLSGEDLVENVLRLLDDRRPLGLFLVGGEPLVRVREISRMLPEIRRRGIEVEIVTSGVIPIPRDWMGLDGVRVVVSIDGLQPEHDRRRKPATYERILQNIDGRRIIVHCTATTQMVRQPAALEQFVGFWSERSEVEGIRVSLYTPQIGEVSEEPLGPELRERVVSELEELARLYPKIRFSKEMRHAYLNPPASPGDCIFANVTECISADLKTPVVPCQLGGEPDCSQCGCVAAVGLQAVGHYRLPGGMSVGKVFVASAKVGRWVGELGQRLKQPGQGTRARSPLSPAGAVIRKLPSE